MATKQKDYLAIARKNVIRPAEVESLPKILVYGRNKKGKTTFSLSGGIERTLMVDCERGSETMKSKNPYVWPVSRWEDIDDCYWALRTGELSPKTLTGKGSDEPFRWVSLDTTTKLNNMALRYIMKKAEEADLDRRPGMVDRRDYNKSGELMKDMINNFYSLPMGVVFTAQERMMSMDSGDSDEDEETTFFVPDLPAGVRGTLNSVVDCIARIYVVRIETKKGLRAQRRLQIGVHERYDTGYRSDYLLPDVIKNPTLPKLVSLMHTGELPSK